MLETRIHYIGVHLEIYVQKRIRAVKYLLMLLNFKMTRLLGSLLKPSRIRLNTIRFCLLIAMTELLVVDFLLFIYLENDSPCLKFFELMSTVFIIPILLSWLMELKSNAKKENKSNWMKPIFRTILSKNELVSFSGTLNDVKGNIVLQCKMRSEWY